MESSGGLLLMLAAAAALVCANSPLHHAYHALISAQAFGISLERAVNDGLMALFFLLVGMEIKREMKEGELAAPGQAVLPLFAAAGGMALPALLYCAVNSGQTETLRGWAIPSATDIAFSLAILGLIGTRLPLSLKVFLTAVAVMDDLGAVLIIALFYTEHIAPVPLALALAVAAALLACNRFGVKRRAPYLALGFLLWLAVLCSGVHATVAGVLLGFMIPLRGRHEYAPSPLRALEKSLHPWTAYCILPLFAFANSGVDFSGISLETLGNPVPFGIALGLFLGKQLGIFLTCFLLIRLGFARLPEGASWRQFYGVCILCGIGFTMSLFIGALAFSAPEHLTETRLGVLAGSFAAGLFGYAWLRCAAFRTNA
jgi:NhaA family Na+:H+ antiporter